MAESLGAEGGDANLDRAPVEASMDDARAVYALGSSSGESARLQRQADELAPDSAALLDRVELRPGESVIDMGCGPRGILDLLCARVSPGGRVVGLDSDPVHIAMASEFVNRKRLRGVDLVCADARRTGLTRESFDLVHARTLLINVPDPSAVMAEMVRLVRPAGWVAGLEPDTEHGICYPPHPAFDRLSKLFTAAFSRNGADPCIGRRMAELYRQAGLEDVTTDARVKVYPVGHSRRTIRVDLVRSLRGQIMEMGLADERELDELDAAAREHLANPDTVVMHHPLFLAWGHKPAPE
ncbi:MAG: methyltransferase domain-containing protein [Solirubrobacterales bacterium]|nr:methyltransferase domain-containing protein [Solirubrobacterales bacterium]